MRRNEGEEPGGNDDQRRTGGSQADVHTSPPGPSLTEGEVSELAGRVHTPSSTGQLRCHLTQLSLTSSFVLLSCGRLSVLWVAVCDSPARRYYINIPTAFGAGDRAKKSAQLGGHHRG